MADIFISYARADRDRIEKLASALEQQGYSVWWDRHIAGGAEFSKDIEHQLAAAKAVIVAWSKESIESRWVKDEAGLAAEAGKLVSLSLDASPPPIGFKQFHAIDFSSDAKAALNDLMRSVALKLDRPAIDASAAPAATTTQAATTSDAGPAPERVKTLLISAGIALVALGASYLLYANLSNRAIERELVTKPSIVGDVRSNDQDEGEEIAVTSTQSLPEGRLEGIGSASQAAASKDGGDAQTVTAPLEKSIAVLPFANLSPNPDDAFFADGMHDDLLTRLAKIADMHVISRTSVMGFSDTARKLPDIARELGVATIMEGSVQRSGARVRINVQLINAASDTHLWAETYDRELTAENIFDIQSEITKAIAAALNAVLSDADEAALDILPTQSLAAYDAYTRARGLLRAKFVRQEEVDGAIKAFDEAIAADPNFAAAYAGKAEAQLSVFWSFETVNKTWLEKARANIDRAQALAPEAVETLIALGYYHYWGFLDYDRADAVIDRALVKAPNNANVWALKGYIGRRAGKFDESINALERAHSLDPLSHAISWQLSESYLCFGRFEEAQAIMAQARAADPTTEQVFTADVRIMIGMGEFERAWTMITETTPGSNWASYYFLRLITAILARDPDKITFSVESFPEELRMIPGYPETHALMKVDALAIMGLEEESKTLLNEISKRINASDDPYPAGWGASAIYRPVDLPGLLGDLAGVRAAVADFQANAAPDAFADLNRHYSIARAFERAGDRDAAFEYLGKITGVFGPSQFLSVKFDPAFDGIRDDPRYLAMKANYDAWAAAQDDG